MWRSSWSVKTISMRQSHNCRNSLIPAQDKPPWMSLGHYPLLRASATVRFLRILGGTHAKTVGARFSIEQPCSQWSVQKRVLFPFPTSVVTAMVKRAIELGCKGSSRSVHGRSALVLNHCHLICSAHAITSKLGMPKPPRSNGLKTFSQATRQQPSDFDNIYYPFGPPALFIKFGSVQKLFMFWISKFELSSP